MPSSEDLAGVRPVTPPRTRPPLDGDGDGDGDERTPWVGHLDLLREQLDGARGYR